MAEEDEEIAAVGKDDRKQFIVFDYEEAVGVAGRIYKNVGYNDLVKGVDDKEDDNDRGLFLISNAGLPSPISNKIILLPDGTAAAKALAWAAAGEDDNGLRRTAANTYLWEHATTPVLKFASTGPTLYGTTLVRNTSDAGTGQISYNGSGTVIDQTTNTEYLVLQIGSSDRLKIQNTLITATATTIHLSGTVGVATATPRRPLDVLSTASPQIRATYTDNSVYSEIEATSAGVMSFITSGAGGYVFNEAGGNFDFRVEGDNLTHLIFVDASADLVGVNTSAPAKRLEILDGSAAQVRMTHTAATHYCDFQVDGSGVLTITPSGSNTIIATALEIDGEFNHDGSTFGILGATPIAQVSCGSDLTNNVTAGGAAHTINDIVAAAVDVTAADLTTTRDAIYRLAVAVKLLQDSARDFGNFS